MTYIPVAAGALAGLLLSLLVGAGGLQLAVFTIAGGLAGQVARMLRSGSERVYWIALGLVILLLLAALMGAGVSGFLAFLPIVFSLTYLVARITRKVLPQSAK